MGKIFQTKVADKIETHISRLVTFSENRVLYDITRKNTAQPDTLQMAIWRKPIACCIPKVQKHTQNM